MSDNPDFDHLATAVGHALAAWSSVEMGIADVFTELTRIGNRPGQIIMSAIVSLDARLDVCDALMAEMLTNNPLELKMWSKCSEAIRKRYKSRHKIAHFSFVTTVEPSGEKRLVIAPFFSHGNLLRSKQIYLGKSEIEALQRSFLELNLALDWFSSLLLRQRAPQPQPSPPDIGPITRFRDLAVQSLTKQRQRAQS